MTDYTGGTAANQSHSGAAYAVVDGTDLGIMINGFKIHDQVKIAERWYDTYQAPTDAVIEGQEFWFDANAAEIAFASGNLELIHHLTSNDGGSTLSRGTDLLGSLPATHTVYIYFLDEKPCKRIYMPKAVMFANGDMDGGSKVFDKFQPLRIMALADTTVSTESMRLVQYQNATDATLLTVVAAPADGAAAQAVDVAVTLTFSEAVGANFRTNILRYVSMAKADGTAIALTATWNAAGTVCTLAHANFSASTTMVWHLSKGIRAATGKYFAGDGSTAETEKWLNFATA